MAVRAVTTVCALCWAPTPATVVVKENVRAWAVGRGEDGGERVEEGKDQAARGWDEPERVMTIVTDTAKVPLSHSHSRKLSNEL